MGLNRASPLYMDFFSNKHTVSPPYPHVPPPHILRFSFGIFSQTQMANLVHDLQLVESVDEELVD